MCQDLCEIIDYEGIGKVIAIGHDWGSTLASRFSIFHASRCVGLVQLSTPYSEPTDSFDLDKINTFTEKMTGYPRLSYIEFLTQPDAPDIWEQHLEAAWTALHGSSQAGDPQRWMRILFCQRYAMREFLLSDGKTPSPPELRHYAKDSALKSHWKEALKSGGMKAPVCWYHALATNVHWEGEMKWTEETRSHRKDEESPWRLGLPVLYIGCTGDAVASTDMQRMAQQQGLLPDLKIEEIESGHWCPYEKPEAIAMMIVEFLRSRDL
jgi:pimeloyl-ACP methyl ester carboxylesterase